MKRFAAICLMLLYAVSAPGAVFNLHFCGGELEEISVAGLGHKGCCCGVSKMKDSCCKDELVVVKVEDEHKQFENASIPSSIFSVVPVETPPSICFRPVSRPVIATPRSNSPPGLLENNDLLVFNCVFRI